MGGNGDDKGVCVCGDGDDEGDVCVWGGMVMTRV